MKIAKNMTHKALLANRSNGKKTPGLHNIELTKMNATKHGLLARNLRFRSEEDKGTFYALVEEFMLYHRPVGPTERELVWEVVIGFWRLSEVYGWELDEVIRHRNVAAALSRALQASSDAQQAEFLEPVLEGWAAEEMVLRSAPRRCAEEKEFSLDILTDKSGQLSVEAKLKPALQTITRYAAKIRRDVYSALTTLQELQRQRLELNPGLPSEEDAHGED